MSLEENKVTEENQAAEANESAEGSVAAEEATDAKESASAEETVSSASESSHAESAAGWDEFSREQWILTHIGNENIMEYLRMEQKKEDEIRKAKESKQKRLLSAFQLTVSLAAVIVVMFLLRDNPTVMVNILYIIAIIAGLWIWKNPRS
ncbi:MAG TPA: hypothetical protein H9852_04360 [Candidatus Mediterraneibacter colneyensis]|nr:hypothetical protein [Candidatus Mediterraneibacter colneyensis]